MGAGEDGGDGGAMGECAVIREFRLVELREVGSDWIETMSILQQMQKIIIPLHTPLSSPLSSISKSSSFVLDCNVDL